MQGHEKRKNPRVKSRLPFEIGCQYAAIKTETKNISCTGVYCYVNRAVPIMSKVNIFMSIPLFEEDKIILKSITCEGIILRYDPLSKEDTHASLPGKKQGWQTTGCNTAIMFTKISKKDKNTIADYVKNQLSKIGA